eukprot:m.154731 g.154731  ORF g.154731 m.154731 type:complete len:282 (+) comp30905_c0_seq3:325-1170(+)
MQSESAITEVRFAGALFAGIIHDLSCSFSDLEGLLFGKEIAIRKVEVGDSQEETITVSKIIVVQSYLPTGGPSSFYRMDGTIDEALFAKYVEGREQDLIGWFKFRRNSSLVPSLRETHVHSSLQQWIKSRHAKADDLLFAMFNATFAPNNARHTYDYCVTARSRLTGAFTNVKFTLVNLDQSLHDGYSGLVASNVSISKDNSAHGYDYSEMNAALQVSKNLATPEYTNESKMIETAYENTMKGIATISKQVADSDAEIVALKKELARLTNTPATASPQAVW